MASADASELPKAAAAALPRRNEKIKSFVSGGVGGMCLVVAGQPFDLIKVRMQTSQAYASSLDCIVKTVRHEGVLGLYRGMLAPLVGATPVFATCFWGYEVGQQIVRRLQRDPREPLGICGLLVAGGLSAVPTTALMAPMERIKCVLQVQGASGGAGNGTVYKGPVDAAVGIVRQSGIRSLFKGTAATLLRDVPGSMAYFGLYEFIKERMTRSRRGNSLSPGAVIVAGGMAGVGMWSIAIPMDVLKSRLQTAPEGKYRGIIHVFQETMRTEGPRALTRGMGAAMLRAFPANAACFLGVEVTRNFVSRFE